ncbi:hypothetical protein TUM12370_30390 [Salmonella enterica subsp. enterica serovar Choleraesuis]|nr:hypothetical protein TUM12370_30390 [Salmonella enterica subsp. enterica serovar Choleraesuis]
MKKVLTALALVLAASGAQAAQSDMTITSLATGKTTQSAFNTMAGNHKLPAWVKKGGTSTPAQEVKLGEDSWQVLESCKPHDCSTERMAVIYSEKTGKMAGVVSHVNAKGDRENLTWLGDEGSLSIDAKTVLLAALTGSLQNHPDAFNYQ